MVYYLPEEIVFEILSRLPVKPLGRFKCLSKTWFSLISPPMIQQKLKSRGPKVLLSSPAGLQSLDCSKPSFTDEGAFINLNFPLKKPDEGVEIIGSFNGLICLYLVGCKSIFLWNPFTGNYKKLPNLVFQFSLFHGFGYDSSANDYKMVLCAEDFDGTRSTSTCWILATKSDSWREIGNTPIVLDIFPENRRGSFLNGTLHWLTMLHDPYRGFPMAISAFDLAQEQIFELPIPDVRGESVYKFTTLSVLNGCLCVLKWPALFDGSLELWVMKKYGVQSSWENLFNIIEDYSGPHYRSPTISVCFTKSDEVILISNWNEILIRYKLKETTYECFKFSSKIEAVAYIETLISPNVFE